MFVIVTADSCPKQDRMKPATVGELLYWSYANLAMAHSSLSSGVNQYGRLSLLIRARLYKGSHAEIMALGAGLRALIPLKRVWTLAAPDEA